LRSSCSGPELQSAQIIEKRFARGAKLNGATGESDIDGKAARQLRASGQRANQFVAKCGDSLREIEESAYWLELLVESGVVSMEKLAPLR
jgi:hypothetical protein